jgi:hypothetical protein
VFPRLKRRQADFFKSGNPGLLAVARLTMREEEDGVENGNGDGSLSDRILTNRIIPIEDLRTEIIHELILVANAVRYTCDLVERTGGATEGITPTKSWSLYIAALGNNWWRTSKFTTRSSRYGYAACGITATLWNLFL